MKNYFYYYKKRRLIYEKIKFYFYSFVVFANSNASATGYIVRGKDCW